MNSIIIAKDNKKKSDYRRLLAHDKAIYSLRIEDIIPYDPDTILSDEQWYTLNDFSKKPYCLDLLKEKWNSTVYDQNRKIKVNEISHIMVYQNSNEYCFQRVLKRSMVCNKQLIHFGEDVSYKEDEDIILINMEPDAIYLRDKDQLLFKRLDRITPIFDGIDSIYKEATDQEVTDFLGAPFIRIVEGFNVERVGKDNRKRIALLTDNLKEYDSTQKNKLFEYTNEYFPELAYTSGSFTICCDSDLKKLLYGLGEKLYTTPVTNRKVAANSTIAL